MRHNEIFAFNSIILLELIFLVNLAPLSQKLQWIVSYGNKLINVYQSKHFQRQLFKYLRP